MSSPPPPPPLPPLPGSVDPAAAPPLSPPSASPETPPRTAKISGLACPDCGGPLEVETGLTVVTCGYCGTGLLVAGRRRVRHYAVEPRVAAEAARRKAGEWLNRGWNKDPRLEDQARVGEAFLCFLPFFRVESDAVGCALGTEERTRTVGSGKNRRTERYEVDVERKVERHLDRTFPAVNVAEWGVQEVDLKGDRLVPFDADGLQRRGLVFPPTGSEMEIFDAALHAFREEVDPRGGLKRVRFFWLETLRERLTVVYYPLWVVRYRFEERGYQVLVDAEDGRVAYGKAPGNDVYRAFCLVVAEAAAAFLATTALQWGLGEGIVGLVILLVVCGLIVAWGWRRFRWGGEIVEGTGVKTKDGKAARALRRSLRRGRAPTLDGLTS